MRFFVGLAVLAGLAALFFFYHRAAPAFDLPDLPLWGSSNRLAPTTMTIVLVGDTGLNGDHSEVSAFRSLRRGEYLGWDDTTRSIASLINGDLNFANLETVVSDRNDLRPELKLFTFRTHPDAVRHLLHTGFNLFSAANNHAMDYGIEGARETTRNLNILLNEGLIAYAGIGLNRDDAAAPRTFDIKGKRIAFSAIGIASQGVADAVTPGQLAYQYDRDFDDVVGRLADTSAAYRILSVHHGTEFEVKTSGEDRHRLRDRALHEAGIDLIVGHHQHVVAGIELTAGKLIFYGLGNFLHLGTQDMSAFDICRDYGLVARVHLATRNGRFIVRAIEAIPIRHMHIQPTPLAPETGRERIYVLNHLAEGLDDPRTGAWGVRFAPQPSGAGLYCAADARDDDGEVGALCSNAEPLEPPPEALRARIALACATSVTRSLVGQADPAVVPAE
jgi:poly-gamma-glutamate capsule biosynthesis protein CapA/YwtB (metallophosphatase superfamily)